MKMSKVCEFDDTVVFSKWLKEFIVNGSAGINSSTITKHRSIERFVGIMPDHLNTA